MTERQQKALEMYKGDYNCAQSVFSSFAEDLGLDKQTALRISTGFGSGMGKMQHTCGAVTGAFMVLGLKYGRAEDDDEENKKQTYALVRRFAEKFEEKHTAINCKDILGQELRTQEEWEKAKEDGLFSATCESCVANAVSILDEMFA